MKEKIIKIFSDASGISTDNINENTRLVADLGLTSFGLADIVVSAEEEYGISIPDELFIKIQTVGDVIRIVENIKEKNDSK